MYLYLRIYVRSGVGVYVPLFVVHTFLEMLEKEVCNGLGPMFVSVLELQIVSRLIILDSVLVFFLFG